MEMFQIIGVILLPFMCVFQNNRFSFCVRLSLSVSLSVCLSLSVPLSVSVCLSLSLSCSLFPPTAACLSLCFVGIDVVPTGVMNVCVEYCVRLQTQLGQESGH